MNSRAADVIMAQRSEEADFFYRDRVPADASDDPKQMACQAYAGLLWCKPFYYYVAQRWIEGDETQPRPAAERASKAENWRNLICSDVLSMGNP